MSVPTEGLTEIYLTREQIERVRRHCEIQPDGPLARAIMSNGDASLSAGPFSVVDKNRVPPSGDKHDFLRMPTYAWPNPDTPDGLPYIIRDGEPGPAIGGPDYDMGRMKRMTAAVVGLAWASLISDADVYAQHAGRLLHAWFVDPQTRMNPNLTYAKYTPGDTPPFPTGVIATHRWVELIQAVGILAGSTAWAPGPVDSLRDWFRRYLTWLETSDQGATERASPNNRGTWYDAQVAAFALFVGDDALARTVLGESCPARLDSQIARDGSLPAELQRTNSLGYTIMTLKGWAVLASIGSRIGSDLWGWRSADGRSLYAAFDFAGRYLGTPLRWPYKQIKPVNYRNAVLPFCAAARAYGDYALRAVLSEVDPGILGTTPAAVAFS